MGKIHIEKVLALFAAQNVTRSATYNAKQEWKKYIETENYEYFITLTFIRRLSDTEAIETVKHFIRRIISSCPRKIRHQVVGVVISERTKKNNHFNGNYHFHIALKGISKIIVKPLLWLYKVAIKCANALRTISGKRLCNTKNVDLKDIYDISGLANYLTKDVRYPYSKLGDSLWPFSERGLDYIRPIRGERID